MVKITVHAIVHANIDKTWNYWIDPKHIVNWNFASDDWYCPKSENDLRKGGKFRSTMASKDEKMSFNFEGVYDEVIDKQKIMYSLEDKRQVMIVFENLGSETKITETFDSENTFSEEQQKTGWQSILNNFKKYCET